MEKPIIYNKVTAPHYASKPGQAGVCSIHLYANGRIRLSNELIKIARLEKGLVFFCDGANKGDFYVTSDTSSDAFKLSKMDQRGATIESSTLVGLICGAMNVKPPVKIQVATVPTVFPGIAGYALDMRHPYQMHYADHVPRKK